MTNLITIELQAEVELQAKLNKLAQGLTDLRPMLDEIGQTLEANINFRFDTGTDPNGKTWAPLSALTPEFHAQSKRGTIKISKEGWQSIRETDRSGSGGPSHLTRDGYLNQSLTHNVGADFVDVGFSRTTPGGKWQVAALHEFGTRTKGGVQKMPRRGLLTADPIAGTLGDEDRNDVYEVVQRYLDRLI